MTDKSINIGQAKALNLSASTKTYPPEHIYKHKTKHWTIVTQVLHRRGRYYLVYLYALVILNSADCHPNPDPQVSLEYPCFVCGKEVLDDHAGIHCDDYHCWYHISCINTVNNTYNILSKSNISRICAKCC